MACVCKGKEVLHFSSLWVIKATKEVSAVCRKFTIFRETTIYTTFWGIGQHLFHRLGCNGLLTVCGSHLGVTGLYVICVEICQ